MTDHNITLYNTLTRRKEAFAPIDPANVRMYVCGPTVYDYAHIGNARPIIVFDVLFRLLRHVYREDHVTYARNITDVDDKINARAAEEYPDLPLNEAIAEVTSRTTKQFHEDIDALGVLPPTVEPRCTQHIGQMIAMIETLIAKGCAYAAEGHVLLDTQRVADYGALSRRSLDDMIAGARVEVAPYKRHPADSVLWKPSSGELPGWDSPWGRGRPGWHIECSAMAAEHLGEVFDIHGGGIDLAFPHHENEVAQSRCAHGTDAMANVWMHNGFLQVEGEKMSKSLGNFITIHELLETENFGGRRWPGEVIRLAMLMTHYRQPIDWTIDSLRAAESAIEEWKLLTANVQHDVIQMSPSPDVLRALSDDLHTPKVISLLHSYSKFSAEQSNIDQLYVDLVFLGLFSNRSLEGARAATEVAQCDVVQQAVAADESEALKTVLERKLMDAATKFKATANVVTTSTTTATNVVDDFALSRSLLFDGDYPRILDPYLKYGPAFISSSDFVAINLIGIDRLNRLIDDRLAARSEKNFAESDRIRNELAEMGIALKDGKDPVTGAPVTTWEVKR